MPAKRFVVATPFRTVCDDHARALERHGLLRFLALGTRRGTEGVPRERTRLLPALGLVSYAFARIFSTTRAEHLRFALHPWFDTWVRRQLEPGDHLISSYGYTNSAFRWARAHGGRTFLDAGNSHPENFHAILAEEHRRWSCPEPPIAPHHYRRSLAMLSDVDFVLSPSEFVTRSFVDRGFRPEQILHNVYPLDLSLFTPSPERRPISRPLTVISTGSLSLRKGTPYLLDAFRRVLAEVPNARLLLTAVVMDNVRPVLARNADLPIDWSPGLPHAALAERLRSSDVFVLPSLEDGFARTVSEALACGIPAVVTPNTGAADFVKPGQNGDIVPIRDPAAIARAILAWHQRALAREAPPQRLINPDDLSFETFERRFFDQLRAHRLA
jgi:starch synthase